MKCRILRTVSFAMLALVPQVQVQVQAFDIFRTGDTSSATPAAPLLRNASCVSDPVDRPLALEDAILQAICWCYQALQADAINLTISRDLLDDAQRSLEIARGRYKEGVGTFVE